MHPIPKHHAILCKVPTSAFKKTSVLNRSTQHREAKSDATAVNSMSDLKTWKFTSLSKSDNQYGSIVMWMVLTDIQGILRVYNVQKINCKIDILKLFSIFRVYFLMNYS